MQEKHLNDKDAMPLSGHLLELRQRLIKIAVILTAGAVAAAAYSERLFALLERPLIQSLPASSNLIALSPIEGWLVYFKIAVVASVFLTAPFWFYHVWAFAAPALAKNERRIIFYSSLASAFCFIAGALFGYFVILPKGLQYLVAIYEGSGISLLPQMQWYLSFILRALVAFGVVFEIPLVLVLLTRLGVVGIGGLRSARKYVIVGIFIFAAIITPGPDIFSQIAVAIPLIIFYELGIIAAVIMERKAYVKTAVDKA